MAERLLRTFVHISDLHLGSVDPNTFQPVYPRWVVQLWTFLPFLSGIVGHEYDALKDLQTFFQGLKQDEDAELITTGDMTSQGTLEQFAASNDYLGNVLSPPYGQYIGLQEADWQERGILGNHDHWAGPIYSIRNPVSLVQNWLATFPVINDPPLSVTSSFGLRFVRIATDADVIPLSPARLLARGQFTNQLTTLLQDLPDCPPEEIRVLLLHHSFEHTGWTLEIEGRSRILLEDLLVKKNFRVILTGHTHVPLVKKFTIGGGHEFLEGRCGTTTQADKVPLGWPTKGKNRALDVQTLLIHRLYETEDGGIRWHSETYKRDPTSGFVKAVTTAANEPYEDDLVI